ncbi:MAG: hypothetical protein HS111_11290 [Kofleriaceae bacterium]|nr:hypothetical protein [Kofleriaceae bacterium]
MLESTGTAVADQHRRFNDKFKDDLTRLSYYGVRYYDNLLLGWTQADPMYRFVPDAAWDEPRRGLLYQFTLANPLAYLDPDGRSPKVLGWVAGGGIGCVAGAIEGSGCRSGAKKGAKVGARVTGVVGAPVVVVLGGVLGMSSDQATPPAMSDKTLAERFPRWFGGPPASEEEPRTSPPKEPPHIPGTPPVKPPDKEIEPGDSDWYVPPGWVPPKLPVDEERPPWIRPPPGPHDPFPPLRDPLGPDDPNPPTPKSPPPPRPKPRWWWPW